MTKHEVHWPEMGIESERSTDGSDEEVTEWLERPILRKVLLTIYLGSEVVRLLALSTIAGGVVVGATYAGLDLDSNTAIVWGFIVAVAFVMAVDEFSRRVVNFSIRYGAFLASTIIVVSLLKVYVGLRARRDSIDDPSTLASSLPIESIPILELYKRRNRLM